MLRIFPMALLRDFGGGGRAAEGRLRRQLEKWDSGDYLDAAFMPSRPRAVRRSRRAGAQSDEQLIRQIHKQVTDKGQQGLLSRARQALESHGLRPSNEETLGELKALHQSAFVPPACGRHARLRQQLDAAEYQRYL